MKDPLSGALVRHFCTYPGRGGAGIAAARLVGSLLKNGVKADLFGIDGRASLPYARKVKYRKDILSNLRRRLRKLQISTIPNEYLGTSSSGAVFYGDRCVHGVAMADSFEEASIIHLHWVCDMVDYEQTFRKLSKKTKVVWTLHDMGPFTGGCCHSLGCDQFALTCKSCPQVEGDSAKREARKSLTRKIKGIDFIKDRLTIICPSQWLARLAEKSAVFSGVPCKVIPNCLDLEIFNPGPRSEIRKLLGFKNTDYVCLFVAASFNSPLKGMQTLQEALSGSFLSDHNVKICYLGEKGNEKWPESWQWLGNVQDERRLAGIYAAADTLIVPSMAENLPNVIAEALSCGLPVLASDVGGIPEMISESVTGSLFRAGQAQDLREKLICLIRDVKSFREGWGFRCRSFAESAFDSREVCKSHQELYERLL